MKLTILMIDVITILFYFSVVILQFGFQLSKKYEIRLNS